MSKMLLSFPPHMPSDHLKTKDYICQNGFLPASKAVKQALHNHQNPDSEFEVKYGEKQHKKIFVLVDLAKQIALITPGQKVSYIADVVYNESNIEKTIDLVKDSDHLFIEASFLEKDKDIAEKNVI